MSVVPASLTRRAQTPLLVGKVVLDVGKGMAKQVTGRAIRLPLRALGAGLQAVGAVRHHLQSGAANEAAAAEVAAVLDPFELTEEVAAEVEQATPGAVLDHAELPIDDFDHLTLGQLRSRIRSLDAVALIQLLDYEKAHADRLPVTMAIENRVTKLTEETAVTS